MTKLSWAVLTTLLLFAVSACTGVEGQPSIALSRSPSASPSASPSPSPTPSPSAVPARYVFPVAGKASYARTHHDYPAADIIAACGLPFMAPADGVILEVTRVDAYDAKVNDGATRGGRSISLLGADGVRYYGAHLDTIEAGVNPGGQVTAGQRLATVGKTGNTSVCHLHFGMSPPCARVADWWNRRGVIWPAPYLDAWRRNETLSPATEIASWQASNGCPASPRANP